MYVCFPQQPAGRNSNENRIELFFSKKQKERSKDYVGVGWISGFRP